VIEKNAFVHQHPPELVWLLSKLTGIESVLEIGSASGHTLYMMAMECMKGSKVCSIDAGLYAADLDMVMKEIQKGGREAAWFHGDSKSPRAIEFAQSMAPFDFIFIDGDHSYEGVKSDWENYGQMAKMVGFHDIAHPHHEVSSLWAEIKNDHKTEECVLSNMGIGLVYR
jgi:hypothetical protein